MPFADPQSTVSVEENRWAVVAHALHTIVAPQIAPFVGPVIDDVYTYLTNTEGIHQQSHTSRLKHYPANKPNTSLQYMNINSNASKDKARWDYAVQSPFDLARLFLQPHMAKSNSLEKCDVSALVGIINGVDDSPCSDLFKTVRKEANDVREIRNTWAHAKFSEWDEAQYTKAFTVMKSLISKLNVTPDAQVFEELDACKTNGKHR